MSETKDLGIYITSNLSWSLQATKYANKANSVLGFVRRTVGPNNPDLFSKLYKSLVRPILEYSSPVWSPHLKKDIATLEKVQRRASRFALGTTANDMSYEDRLKRLKWPTLEKRRTLSSLTECYKTINGLNCLNPHEFFSLPKKSAKLNCCKHSFFLRIVNLWNNLRKETAEAKDLRTFRNKLVNEFSSTWFILITILKFYYTSILNCI